LAIIVDHRHEPRSNSRTRVRKPRVAPTASLR